MSLRSKMITVVSNKPIVYAPQTAGNFVVQDITPSLDIDAGRNTLTAD